MLHANPRVFRVSYSSDLDTFDPIKSRYSVSSYPINALYTPLLRFQKGVLSPNGAKCDFRSQTKINCQINPDWKWSDGKPVLAEQLALGLKTLNESASARMGHFSNIKSLVATSPRAFAIQLHKPDINFLYKLLDPALSPRREDVDMNLGQVTTGTYFVFKKKPGVSTYLKPNPHFFIKNQDRPDVEFITTSDHAGFNLFETGDLNWLTRITAEKIPLIKNRSGFMQVPVHRFDYVGLGPELTAYTDLRKNLIHSLHEQYQKFVSLFGALGTPGCMSLSRSLVPKVICYEKNEYKRSSESDISTFPKLSLYYATLGGDDIARSMEFFQAGWKKNLGLNVELKPTELGVLNQMLRTSPPTLFRRGVPLDEPTCLAALEVFETKSPDNYIQLSDQTLDRIIQKLRVTRSKKEADKLCIEGQKALLATHRIIPLGEIHYTMLTDEKFDGFLVNELNQLDLSGLKPKGATR